MDTVEFQGPGGGQFTIGEDVEDEEEQDDNAHEQRFDEGKVDGQSFGVYADFEPQRHTDLT